MLHKTVGCFSYSKTELLCREYCHTNMKRFNQPNYQQIKNVTTKGHVCVNSNNHGLHFADTILFDI